jgi:uncharacterized Ntn-hydrolase superfamily protein
MHCKLLVTLLLTITTANAAEGPDFLTSEGTYSIIARDPAAGELGMAVQSKAYAAANRTVTAKGGLAVIAHQADSNPMYGALGIDLLQRGMTPQQALDILVLGDEGRERRQVSILDMQGRSASWTGSATIDWKGHHCTLEYCVQGNILVGPQVLDAMAQSFEASAGTPLAERMLAALDAGQAAGGDRRGMQAAGLLIVKPLAGPAGFSDRLIDIRVDDHRAPLSELRRLLNLFRSTEKLIEAHDRLASNETDAGLRLLLAARDLAPESDNVWVSLAIVYMITDRKDDCFDALRKAVALNPANKTQLPRMAAFQSIRLDPEFLKIID